MFDYFNKESNMKHCYIGVGGIGCRLLKEYEENHNSQDRFIYIDAVPDDLQCLDDKLGECYALTNQKYGSLNDMHQLRFDTGTEDERIVKLSNWLSQNDCRVKSQIPDFDIIVKDTGIEILKYTGSKNHVVIESTYGGNDVTAICNGAFAYCDSILTLSIPKSVLVIEEKAFEHCANYLTVYCHEDSVAYTFCVKNNIPFKVL